MLKNYHRKKFFYHLFMLDSPVSAGLMTFNATFAALMLKPFAILSAAALVINRKSGIPTGLFIIFPLLWLLMSIITIAIPVCSQKRKKKHDWNWKSKDFYLKHWELLFIFPAIIIPVCSNFSYWSIIAAFIFISLFFLLNNNGKKLKKRATASLLFNVFLIAAFALSAHFSNALMHKKTEKISKLLGRDVSIYGYLKREEAGFQFDREPLKTLIKSYPKNSPGLIYNILNNQNEAKKKLLEYEKKYPLFCQSAKEFAAIPASQYGIGNKISPHESLYMAELFSNQMRETARYFAWQIQCSPADKKLLAQCNEKMLNIRNRCLNSNNLIYHLCGISIETMRIQALVSTLCFNDITEKEFHILLGTELDWHKHFRYSHGDELTHMASLIKYLLTAQNLTVDEKSYESYDILRWSIPHHFKVYMALNYMAFADNIENIIKISQANAGEAEKLAMLKNAERKTGFIICDLFGHMAETSYKRFVQSRDMRTIAKIAFKIIDYRRCNGKLPDDLNFLPQVPHDGIYQKNFIFQTGRIALFNNDDENSFNGFILAVDEKPKYSKYSYCRLVVAMP